MTAFWRSRLVLGAWGLNRNRLVRLPGARQGLHSET